MSIERTPPFEGSRGDKSEKGFRDALIMFTILENIKRRPEDACLVVTKDELLREGLDLFASEFETTVTVVPDLDQAVAHIDSRISATYRAILLEESNQAIAMLEKYKDRLAKQVDEIRELTEIDLGVRTLLSPSLLEAGESIERVNSFRLAEIESAVWRDRDKPASRILFRIRCIATVITTVRPTNELFGTVVKCQVAGDKPLSPFLKPTSPWLERQRDLSVWLYGEAYFVALSDGEWKLNSIRVDKSQPGPDEMIALSLIPSRSI
jgi:hypothetical protein